MPALTDRERAKRAKMVARFNAIKHHNNIAESMTAPQAEKVAGNQENRLYKKEPIQISVGNNDRDVVTDEEVREEAEATAVEPPQQEVVLESKLENSSGPTVRSKPPNVTLATTTLSISTTRKTALSVEIPLTPSKNTPRARSTPRSRRNTSIADAKKKLAAARKVSSSSKPRIEKDDLKDHAKEIAVKLDRNEWDENPAKVESMAENENEKEGLSNEKKEIQEKSSIVVKHKIGTKSKISITSPGGRRSDKIAKIRARSPRIADRHKGLVKASAQLDEPIEPKKSLSDEFAKVAPTEREKETKKPSSDEFAYTKERWSDEFNEPIRPQPSADDAPYLGDVFDNQRLSYGSDSSTTRDQSKNLKKLSAEMNTHMMSDEFSSPRLSIESGTTVASGSTLLARDREAEQQHQKPKMQKTWQEQSKIVAKAKQYRKWQHHTTTTTKKTDISVVEPIVERFEEVKEGHLHLGSYEGNVQQGDLFEPKLRAASKMRDGMSESEPALFEPKPQSNVESFCGLVDSEDDEFEPQTRSNGLSGLVDVKEGLFEPRPQYKSDDNLGPECPLDPSQIAYLHENQEYHIEEEEVQEEEARSKVKENDRSQAIGDATETQLIPARQFSMSNSTPGSSVVKPSTIATVDTEQVYPTTTQYKTLVPSRSDASKHSELSLNQLTVSTSEVQSLAGVEFLSMSKDTDAQHRSDDFEDDQFQSQFDWPVDAFSPTSWGAGQAEPSSSEDSNWEKAVPDTPNSLTAPATAEDKSGWDFKGASSAVEWEAEKENEPTKKTEDEWDSSWGQTELDDTQNDTADEREDGVDEKARREAEERINELNELDICGVSNVDQYEGFSEVEHADCPSRMESKDGYSPRAEYSNVLSPSGESKCSEGTMGTATEFDPISMFEASESFSVDIEKKDSFPTCDVNKNIESVASWSSAKVLKPNDDSTNSAFGSLRAGNPMDTSTLFGNDKSAMDTPSGRESLGSWWQNRYASTQNNDINAAVQDALNETTSSEEQRSDRATERCTSSSRCRPEFETPKHLGQQSNGMLQDPLSARAKRFLQDEPSSPDDDSIFGDLDDDSLAGAKHHTSSATNSRRKSSLSKMGTIISNAETDDIFAGVSVNSRQAKPQKDSSAVPMKSLLDGSTTTGSQSIHQKTKSSSKEPECNLPKVEEQTAKPIGLFMMDGTYGVINVKDSERNSPSNASVTSDITTSVIFGGDYGKKRSFSKKGASYSLDRESPDTIIEVPDVLSDKPVCSPRKGHTSAQDQTFDNEDTENVDPQGGGQGDINAQNNEDFQKASDAADEATETSNPSLLKRAFLMVEKGKNLVGDSTKAKCAPPESSVGKAGAAVFMLPLALPMACGMLGASSFAYCASKASDFNSSELNSNSSEDIYEGSVANASQTSNPDIDHRDREKEAFDKLDLKVSQTGTVEDTVGSNQERVTASSSSYDESNTDVDTKTKLESYGESNIDILADNEDRTTLIEEGTVEDERTLNTNEPTISTYDPTVTTCDDDVDDDDDDDDDESFDEDESDYEDESDFTEAEEGTEITDIVPLSELEASKWKAWDDKNAGDVLSPRSKKSLHEEQSRAYEKLLFYAYTAMTVPLPSEFVEKSEELDPAGVAFPPVLSPRGAELRCEAMKLLLTRLGEHGIEVLKLNRERKWQSRFLTITKEVVWFKKSDDIRYNKIDCCPQGLLWVKKFNGHNSEHSVEAVGKTGKGGILFTSIRSVSVTTDNFSLSKKQKRGKFKESFTLVLHADFDGKKRDILFRCSNKDDIYTLSSGFQAIIDRIKNETLVVPKPLTSQLDKLPMTEDQMVSPVAIAKPFSPKAAGSDDRWEV